MNHRKKTLCCLLLIALLPLTMGGCSGRGVLVDGVANGISGGIAGVIEHFVINAVENDDDG